MPKIKKEKPDENKYFWKGKRVSEYICNYKGNNQRSYWLYVDKFTLKPTIYYDNYPNTVATYGQEWEVGDVTSSVPYRAGQKHVFIAHISIKIGLRSINITLEEKSYNQVGHSPINQLIKYNEQFLWTWDQGRYGFGPNAGNLQKGMRQAQKKGLPTPIIWILDYLSIDGEGLRCGRLYRTAGWYCHILLWSAFSAWIMANIFLQSVGRYTAYLIGLTGAFEITSCIIWLTIRNCSRFIIRFPNGKITPTFGSTFWLTGSAGVFCLLLTFALIIMDLRYPNSLSAFLGVDILDQYDEHVVRTIEFDHITEQDNQVESIELEKFAGKCATKDLGVIFLKRRSTIKRAQKNLVHISSVPVKIYNYDNDMALYGNESIQPLSSSNDRTNNKFTPPILKRNIM
ncbi:hypothetical protein PV325_007676 [Microctonus aethiopoides]|nr:hypothetical protein PV325_007676 [Microctonus aethiopoides]